MKIGSWNVNGIRAVQKKGFIDWLQSSDFDILAIQETKAHPDQLDEALISIEGFHSTFMSAEKKGYSGTALYSKEKPQSIESLGNSLFDSEGRVLIAKFSRLTIVNCYFPNSQDEGKRIDYKIEFCDAILDKCATLVNNGENVVLCGDFNIAHYPIDLARPKQNEGNPGYLPEERNGMDKLIKAGWIDTFRMFTSEGNQYSWWSYRFSAREKNIGWRIDYHCVNKAFAEQVIDAKIHPEIEGSDHCPVSITLK